MSITLPTLPTSPKAYTLEEEVVARLLKQPSYIKKYRLLIDEYAQRGFEQSLPRRLYETLCVLADNDELIDFHSVVRKMHSQLHIIKEDVIEIYDLLNIAVGDESTFIFYLKKLLNEQKQRTYEKLASLKKPYAETLDELQLIQQTIDEHLPPTSPISLRGDVSLLSTINQLTLSIPEELFIPTGINGLDDRLGGGLQAQRLYMLGGRPKAGKSALALKIATNIAMLDYKVLVFSSEMIRRELGERCLAQLLRVPLIEVMRGKHKEKIVELLNNNASLARLSNLMIDDTASISPDKIRQITESLHAISPLSLVVVDHLQRLRLDSPSWGWKGKNETEARLLEKACQDMKTMAKDLKLTVLMTSQLNRLAEDNEAKLTHFKGSGGIEQEADVPILLELYTLKNIKALLVKIVRSRFVEESVIGLVFEGAFMDFRTPTADEGISISAIMQKSSAKSSKASTRNNTTETIDANDDTPF